MWAFTKLKQNMAFITTDSTTFELNNHETLLEGLERTGHKVDYQCRSGYCGLCRTKLLSGSVSYAELPMAFMLPDDILPCCCQVNENIRISAKMHDLPYDSEDLFADNLL